ncbi:MAG: hypothetical protein IJ642_04140 [Oscillospiraceae bacterium]|nr:hypothetical protein [Oscillospiraceae bacterium]
MSTLKTNLKKGTCTILAAITLTAGVAFPSHTNQKNINEPFAFVQTIEANAASKQVVRGNFNYNTNWTGYTTVYAYSYKSWGKTKYKSPKLKFCAFDYRGRIKDGRFTVEVTTPENRNFRVTKNIKGSSYWTLNYGYSKYCVRLKRNYNTWVAYDVNTSNTRYWSIDATSNCWFY